MAKLRGFKDSRHALLVKMLNIAIKYIDEGELDLAREVCVLLKKPID